MEWDPNHRYKLLGKLIHAKGEYLIAFDLTATETYRRIDKEGKTRKTSRVPVFPAEWQNQFGLPYNEHKQSLQVDILNGYAVFSIKDAAAEDADGNNGADVPEDVLRQLETEAHPAQN